MRCSVCDVCSEIDGASIPFLKILNPRTKRTDYVCADCFNAIQETLSEYDDLERFDFLDVSPLEFDSEDSSGTP